jgi:tetratricopeptide (TPR) repeat protein
MPAWKVFLTVAILAVLVAFGVFLIFPDMRPGVVKSWFRSAQGYTPAKTPDEAIDKFKKAIKARDYEAASLYTTAEYAEQMRKCAKAANKLGTAIDELMHNVEDVAAINTPVGKLALALLEPFPTDFKYEISKKSDDAVLVTINLEDPKEVKTPDFKDNLDKAAGMIDPRIARVLVPRVAFPPVVPMKLEGDKEKSWRIDFPVTQANPAIGYPGMREQVEYLRANYGNYVRALDNLKYAIKHEAATKADFEMNLRRELSSAK